MLWHLSRDDGAQHVVLAARENALALLGGTCCKVTHKILSVGSVLFVSLFVLPRMWESAYRLSHTHK